MHSDQQRLLDIYLNDHLAGAGFGTHLARRMVSARQHFTDPEALERLAAEIAEDRASLLKIMNTLGIAVRRRMNAAGYLAEKTGRLKPNGRLLHRSPLSSLLELEMLRVGVEGKTSGWRALRTLADHDDRLDQHHLDTLIERAQQQSTVLQQLHHTHAQQTFP
ncbi:hypothetical protein [Streptantibioticus parmotrematis]|uniref:hypothetical protein n=1 Tax=Streptantibioticus parmotrematis TaxID=2873249 RepID=UPI0027E07445|nr:hypothetical protein [Streptantibioticus parmotrematis]